MRVCIRMSVSFVWLCVFCLLDCVCASSCVGVFVLVREDHLCDLWSSWVKDSRVCVG